MIRRRLALAVALVALAVSLGALAIADDDPAQPDPAPPNVVVAEQVTAARAVVPFGLTSEGNTRTVWATGRTRRPSTYSGRDVTAPGRDDPAATLLLQGTIAGDDRATAWRRAPAPLDRDGNPLPAGGWRVDDGSARASTDAVSGGDALHAGATTPAGAAALLVRIGGSAPRAAVLARTSDGRFRELPAPPGADPFAAPAGAVTPMAVVDVPTDGGTADRGRTGVLLAPAGGDGVLRWDGAGWVEEPWQDEQGDPSGARTALALGATAEGDAVALFAGTAGAPISLARRDSAAGAFRPVPVDGSTLLTDTPPAGVKTVAPVAAPGQPLTVATDHWWLDLQVTRDDDVTVSTTVHLRPGATAVATGTWCSPSLAGCDRDLRFGFATTRGYRSQAFADDDASHPFGQRAITSPVIPQAPGDTTAREASASGGFLELRGTAFTLRSGVGDDGTAATQAGAFAAGGFAVIGGARTVGRTMPTRRTAFGTFDDVQPDGGDAIVDVASSPPGTPAEQAGLLAISAYGRFIRQQGSDPWLESGIRATVNGAPVSAGSVPLTSMAWDTPSTVILAGRAGILIELPVPTVTAPGVDEGPTPTATIVPAAAGLDLLDVAARDTDAWAVGRDGAALHRSGGRWTAVSLPAPLAGAHLQQVAYAGTQALVASTAGLLTATPSGELALDTALADLMREDGRPVAAASVAGLPDGAAVVDGRYVRESAAGPWRRLADPAEGDVVAMALWRDPAGGARVVSGPGTEAPTTLRIAASTADRGRPVFGRLLSLDFGGGDGSGGRFTVEASATPTDGRLALLGPEGWSDAMGVGLSRSTGRDLATWSAPIAALSVDPAGNGWAVGGEGSFIETFAGTAASSPTSFAMPLGQVSVDTRPPDVRQPPPPRDPDVPLRLFVGGHPACLDECAGRGDQGTAPDANVRDALATVARLSDPASGPAVLVVGGGRASSGGAPLTPAGARRYAQLLRSDPSITVAAAIGTADAATPESRAAFRSGLAGLFPAAGTGPKAVQPVTDPAPPLTAPGSDTVAYAFDVPGSGFAPGARVAVIDNAGGELRGGASGAQAQWLSAVLSSPSATGVPKIVVGAVRLDDAPDAARDRSAELSLLAGAGATAYVATDGIDDVNADLFGGHTAGSTIDVDGRRLGLYRTSGLGHALPFFTFLRAFRDVDEGEDDDASVPVLLGRSDGWDGPALLSLAVDPAGGARGTVVPVFTHLNATVVFAQAGQADLFSAVATGGAGSGFLWNNPTETPPGPPAEARAGGVLSLASFACQLLVDVPACRHQLPPEVSYTVADPSIAVFVRAEPQSIRTGAPPKLVFDERGDPIPDPASAVLCPIRAGVTTITVTASGSSATYPLRVGGPSAPRPGSAACAFTSSRPPTPARPPEPATPAKPAPITPPSPVPAPTPPAPTLPPSPVPVPTPPIPTPAPPLAIVPPAFTAALIAGGTSPPVAPNPKPAPAAPPATPTGMSSQYVPQSQVSPQTQGAPQTQLSPARQQQREAELAREGTRLGATVYEPRGRGVPAGLILGGAGVLLAAGTGGVVLGQRRRTAVAAARRRVLG